MNLSENLTLAEVTKSDIAIKNGIDNTPHGEHLDNLMEIAQKVYDPLFDHFGVRIPIPSGYRSPALNKKIGGAVNSQHCKGQALDLDVDGVKGVENRDLFQFIAENITFDQLIWEYGTSMNPDWVHVSYKKDGANRGEMLRCTRENGKQKYAPFK